MRTGLALVALLASMSAGSPLVAQPMAADSMAARTPVARTPERWRFEQCMGGLTYGAPLKWAAAYGVGLVRENDERDLCLLGSAKIGIGGAGVHVGVANAFGPFGSGTAVTLGVMRMFDRPLNALARRTYVGGSVHIWPILAIGGEIGWYTRLGKDPAGSAMPRSMLVWSTGFGF